MIDLCCTNFDGPCQVCWKGSADAKFTRLKLFSAYSAIFTISNGLKKNEIL